MQAKLDLLLLKPYITSRNRCTDGERARCIIWITEGCGATAVQRLFRNEYSRMLPIRFTIRLWRADYQQRGTHTHRGGNGRQQISAQTRNRIDCSSTNVTAYSSGGKKCCKCYDLDFLRKNKDVSLTSCKWLHR